MTVVLQMLSGHLPESLLFDLTEQCPMFRVLDTLQVKQRLWVTRNGLGKSTFLQSKIYELEYIKETTESLSDILPHFERNCFSVSPAARTNVVGRSLNGTTRK